MKITGSQGAGLPSARQRQLLCALTLLAFALRLWGIGYGIPQPWTRPDELRWVRIALGLLEDPDPRWFQWPTLHAYLLAGVYALWGALKLALGYESTWHGFLNPDPAVYPADLVLLGRAVCALIGALTVPIAWRLGEAVGPRGAGVIVAIVLAVSFGPVRDAHWTLIESLLLFGIVLTLWLCTRVLEQPTPARFALAGLACGLTTSAKYSGITLLAPIVLALVMVLWRERRVLRLPLDHRLWLVVGLVLIGFLAGSPFVLVSRAQFKAAMAIREWSYRDASFGTAVGFVHHLLFSLRYSHGALMEIVGLAGLVMLGLRDARRALITGYAAITYLAIGPARIVPMRYASSLAPAIAFGVAWVLLALPDRIRIRRALALAILALIIDPLYRDVCFDRLLCREDTRVSARRWLDQHLAAKEAILSRDSKAMRWGRPFMEDRYEVIPYVPRLARRRRAPYALIAESSTGYVPWAPEIHDVLRGVGRVVSEFDPFRPGARPVYDPHDAFFVPVSGFEGVLVPGPKITIYSLRPPEAAPP